MLFDLKYAPTLIFNVEEKSSFARENVGEGFKSSGFGAAIPPTFITQIMEDNCHVAAPATRSSEKCNKAAQEHQ